MCTILCKKHQPSFTFSSCIFRDVKLSLVGHTWSPICRFWRNFDVHVNCLCGVHSSGRVCYIWKQCSRNARFVEHPSQVLCDSDVRALVTLYLFRSPLEMQESQGFVNKALTSTLFTHVEMLPGGYGASCLADARARTDASGARGTLAKQNRALSLFSKALLLNPLTDWTGVWCSTRFPRPCRCVGCCPPFKVVSLHFSMTD